MQYKMTMDDLLNFADFIGIENKRDGDELKFRYCPYCKSSITREDEWKFGVNTKTGAYGCFRSSCGKHGHFVELCRDFGYKLGFYSEQQYRQIKQPKHKIVPHESAIAYLEGRGISREVAEAYGITALKDRPNILVFPFFNEYGKVDLIKYRKMDFKKGRDKNKEWCEKDCRHILFGMKQCVDFNTLVITEGQLDSLSVAQAGIKNAVSVPTGANGFNNWIPNCWDWITKFQEIIVFGDFEKGHMTLLDDLLQRLPNRIKAVRTEDYMGEKDANDILRSFGEDAIRKCIENAKEPGIDYVIELADVKHKKDDEPVISTGILELDEALKGGIRCGQVLLLTGKTGEGKSTLASQILAEALNQRYKIFAYSGELDNEDFQDCLNAQIAGDQNMVGKENQFHKMDYYLDDEIDERIKDWYRGMAYIYDNNRIPVKDRPKLPDIVKQVVVRKGVQLVLMDNLMTAMEFVKNQNDLYLAQTNFVAEMKAIAQNYHVAIILIAHPRKTEKSSDKDKDNDLINDDVAGSSNITNLVDIIVTYSKAKDTADYDSVLQLTKNRKHGKLRRGKDSIHLLYSEKSKRISGMRCLEKHYGWEKQDMEAIEIDVPF